MRLVSLMVWAQNWRRRGEASPLPHLYELRLAWLLLTLLRFVSHQEVWECVVMSELRRELAAVLNRHCAENISNTPDFILAHFLEDCLKAFDTASLQRADWYRRHEQPGRVNDTMGVQL